MARLLQFFFSLDLLVISLSTSGHLPPTHDIHTLLSRYPSSSSPLPQCQIGFIKGNSSANINRQDLSSCRTRGYQDRNSFWKIFNGRNSFSSFFFDEKLDIEQHNNEEYDSIVHLFHSLTSSSSNNITNLLFLGDSVSSQLFYFLLCDFYYSQKFVVSPLQWIHRSCQFCLSYVDIWLPIYPYQLLRLYNRQFNLPCIHDNHEGCQDDHKRERISAAFTQNLLRNLTNFLTSTESFPIFSQSSISKRTIVILNYGLHILSPEIANWSLRGMIRGIFSFLSDLKIISENITIFYRETSSQVFASTSDGAFVKQQSVVMDSAFCCEYPRLINEDSNWRNHLAQKYFYEIDSNWRKIIGWIPFYNISLDLYDLRAESHKPNIVDCTHFIYFPTAYLSLWKEIESSFHTIETVSPRHQ